VDDQRVEWVAQPKYSPDRYELTEKGRWRYVTVSGSGSPNSPGTVGAPGRLTHVSEILDPALTDASSTLEDGSNTFQGRASLTSWQSRGVEGGVFTVTVSLDSRTAGRLKESLSGRGGEDVTEDVGFSLTMVREAPRSTSPSTSRRSR